MFLSASADLGSYAEMTHSEANTTTTTVTVTPTAEDTLSWTNPPTLGGYCILSPSEHSDRKCCVLWPCSARVRGDKCVLGKRLKKNMML